MRDFSRAFEKQSIKSITPVEKGWSNEEKYCIITTDGMQYLLRISPANSFEAKRREYAELMKIQQDIAGAHLARVHALGHMPNGDVYLLFDWLAGEDAETVLPNLAKTEQYRLGYAAGEALHSIHAVPAPSYVEAWEARFRRKVERKIEQYCACPLKYTDGEKIIAWLEANKHLLSNRPQVLHHGDYHCGNMIVMEDGRIGIIDFNRLDYGDPWEEYNRIVWCAQLSTDFACGRIDGYFQSGIPKDFFLLLKFYILSNTLSSLPWAIPFGQGEVDVMIKQEQEIMLWYNGLDADVPIWYANGGNRA